MNIACSNCPAKYAVPDDKVRGRKVRITCKRCGAGIVVDGTKLGAQAEPGPASGRQRHSTKVGGLEAPKEVPPAAPRSEPRAAAPVHAPAPEDEQWTVAITDEDQREMTLAQILDSYAKGLIDADTFVWREGMDDWLTPFEIPVIEVALRQRGLAPRSSAPPEPSGPEAPRPHDQSGAWREPGRWDKKEAAANVSFDDVTVAMAAPKAQALLEAVAATGPVATPAADRLPPLAEEESTVEADLRRFGAPMPGAEEPVNERRAPRPAAGAPPEQQPIPKPKAAMFARVDSDADGTTRPAAVAAKTAARRGNRDGEVDLFARKTADEDAPRARMPSAPDAPRARMPSTPPEAAGHAAMTGARNESSVLFTLDQLARPQAKPAPKAEKIDAESLFAPSPSVEEAGGPPSVAKIGGGGLFPTAAMAAPDFNAPAAPSTPSNPPPPTAAQPIAPPEKATGSSSLWIVIGILGILAAGGASYFFVVRSSEPNAEPATTTANEVPALAPLPAPKPEMTASAAPAETPSAAPASPSAAAPAAVHSAAQSGAAPAATGAPAAPTGVPNTAAAPGTTAPAAPKPVQSAQPKPAPTATDTAAAAAEGPAFDKDAAAQALGAAATSAQSDCASQDGPHGTGKVTVTFTNSGRATNALVSGDFAGSALGGCIARVFRSTKVPAFGGDPVRVTKTVHIP